MLIDNHGDVGNRGKIKSHWLKGHNFRFCEIFKRVFKKLRFHLKLRAADSQNLIENW